MIDEGYLDTVNLDYYRIDKVPGNMQYLSAQKLIDSLDYIFSAQSHTFTTSGKVLPSIATNYCEILLHEVHGKSSALEHQSVFVPQRLGGGMDVNFNDRKYYSFRIDKE